MSQARSTTIRGWPAAGKAGWQRAAAFAWCVLGVSSCAQIAGFTTLMYEDQPGSTGAPCTVDGDCRSCTCAPEGRCQEPAGLCPDGTPCGLAGTCASAACTTGPCRPATCTDGLKDGSETDVDCGGLCPPCADGSSCDAGGDCTSGVCTNGVCNALGAACTEASHCATSFCVNGVCCGEPCTDEGPLSCAYDGNCNHDGTCQRYPAGTPCGVATCSAGTAMPAGTCDGMGTCTQVSPPTFCSPYACDGAVCASGCAHDSDCAAGPCNVCPPAAKLCLAPLAPVASLAAGACRAAACHPSTLRRAGRSAPSPWASSRRRSRSTARTCGSPTGGQRHRAVADRRDARHLRRGPRPERDRVRRHEHVGRNRAADTVTELSPTGATLGTFPVGQQAADGIAFDGTNMWVVNDDDGSVTKLSPTGATLGTFTVGIDPEGDRVRRHEHVGRRLDSNNVTELSPAGAPLGTFAVGDSPVGIAFDGTNMWVANYDGNDVTELSPTGATLGTFPVGTAPMGDRVRRHEHVGRQRRQRQRHQAVADRRDARHLRRGRSPQGIAFDGTHMWVANNANGTVTEL